MESTNSNNQSSRPEVTAENSASLLNIETESIPTNTNPKDIIPTQTIDTYPDLAYFTSQQPTYTYPPLNQAYQNMAVQPTTYQSYQLSQNVSAEPVKRKTNRVVFWTLLALALVLLVGGTGLLVWLYQDNQMQEQLTAQKNNQTTAQAQIVATANNQVTAAVQTATSSSNQLTAFEQKEQATSTAQTYATATAIAPATATAQILQPTVQPLDQQAKQVYQSSGLMQLTRPDQFVIRYAKVNLQSFIAKATFQNPIDPNDHKWNYGFLFRHTGTDYDFRLYVEYSGYWQLELSSGHDDDGYTNYQTIADGYVTNLNTRAAESNELSIYVTGDKGLFFLNDRLVTNLDLISKLSMGDVMIGAGFVDETTRPKEVINYKNFTVYSLDTLN